MEIREGYFYHIKDEFFNVVQDATLMSNKEGGKYRPHYFAIRDGKNKDIFWMVPVSSRFEKYQEFYNQQVKKYRRCTKVVLGKCDGRDAAFLIQNAFPVTSAYFDHLHTSNGIPLELHGTTGKTIVKNLQNNLRLQRKGIKLFFADIDRIYKLMESTLSKSEKPKKSEMQKKTEKVAAVRLSDKREESFESEESVKSDESVKDEKTVRVEKTVESLPQMKTDKAVELVEPEKSDETENATKQQKTEEIAQ